MADPGDRRRILDRLDVLSLEQAAVFANVAESEIDELVRQRILPLYIYAEYPDHVFSALGARDREIDQPLISERFGVVPVGWVWTARLLDAVGENPGPDRISYDNRWPLGAIDSADLDEPHGCVSASRDSGFLRRDLRVFRVELAKILSTDNAETRDDRADTIEVQGKLRASEAHKQRCQAVAALLWAQDPNRTIADVLRSDEINGIALEHEPYAEATLRKWIKELCPNRRPGRPRKTIAKGVK